MSLYSRLVVLLMFGILTYQLQSVTSFRTLATLSHSLKRKGSELHATIHGPVRVRFAPSPTGSLHIGGARTALFNWLLAKKTNGKFIIRVEDTDEARSTRKSEESILQDIKWLGMQWDEGPEPVGGPYSPYRQSERKSIYKQHAEQLIAAGHAYRCFCTEEELEKKRKQAEDSGVEYRYDGMWRNADPAVVEEKLRNNEPYTVRFRVPPGKIVSFEDVVRGKVTWDAHAMLGDFIILRSNGMPVYNYCVAVDDANMKISHVIRAEEHLSNTLRQLLILEALNYTPPTYAHCSLILGSDRSKLSKRHGATSVTQFMEQGFLPEAMLNYLANLGFNDGTDKEIYSVEELIKAFSMSRIVKSAAVFDMDKLRWINGQHLRLKTLDEIRPQIVEVLKKPPVASNDSVIQPVAILSPDFVLSEANTGFVDLMTRTIQRDAELLSDGYKILNNILQYNLTTSLQSDVTVKEVLTDSLVTVIKQLCSDYKSGALPRGNEPNFGELWKAYIKQFGKALGLKGKHLYHPIRFALTGRMSGPELADILQLLSSAKPYVHPDYPLVSLEDRIAYLSTSFSLEECLRVANEAEALRLSSISIPDATSAVAVAADSSVTAVVA